MSRRGVASAATGAIGLGVLALALRGPGSDLDDAAAWARAHAAPGDVVVASGCRGPDEVDRFAPVPAVCAEAPPLGPLARFRRVLAARPSPTLATLLDARFGPARRGGAGVRIYATPPARFDLGPALANAIVSRGGAPCPRHGKRHACAGASWRTVEPKTVTIGGLPLDCVFAHPSEDGLAIEVPLPAGVTKLRGAVGLSDRAAARRGGPPVALTASLGARVMVDETIPNRRGLVPLSFGTEGAARSPLRLSLTTPSQGARSFCVLLWGFAD